MYKQYKIVVNTAAGRRRYMQYLIPFIVASDIVDRYDIWINTHNGADIEFFKQIAAKFPKINLVWQPDGVVNGNASINAFYKACTDSDAIYFKLDDDIVWMEPGLIESMVKFRVDNPQYFIVSPLVINNSLSTYLLQIDGKIQLDKYYNSAANHPILWESGHFASALHQWFIDNYLTTNNWDKLHIGKKEMGMTRFSINAILWFGHDMKQFSGIVPGDDEEFLSCIKPSMLGKANAWNGDTIAAHFAFFTQREQLDRQNILEQYGKYCIAKWDSDPKMKQISDTVQQIINAITTEEAALTAQPSPYRKVIKTKPFFWKRLIPKWLKNYYHNRQETTRRNGFIIS